MSEHKPRTSQIVAKDGHIYSKSATANATVAPTSGNTQSAETQAITQNQTLSEEQLDFVTLVSMHWAVYGELLNQAIGKSKYNIREKDFSALWASVNVQAALEERGILTNKTSLKAKDQWRQYSLTPAQLIVANTMLDLIDSRSDRKKLQDLGVSTHQYQNWLRQPEFEGYLRDRAEAILGAGQHDAALALMDKVRSGDVRALEFYYEYIGKFSRRPAENSGIGFTQEHVTQLVQQIIEIVVEEVTDPAVGQRIGERLRNLIAVRSMADQLVRKEPIVVPEVMPSREITPEIEKLMNSGIGVE